MARAVMVKPMDVLSSSIARRTRRILDLREKGKRKARELALIVADIGEELIAVKAELDRGPDKTAWLGWLKGHVHYSEDTAQNYMRVAQFRQEKPKRFGFFSALDASCLYRVACLPEKCCKGLTPETKLTDPKTRETKPLKEMSARQLDRALDKLEGKKIVKETPSPAGKLPDIETGIARPSGSDRETFAASVRAAIERLASDAGRIRTLSGKLRGESKQATIAASEVLRKALLKWPAWAARSKELQY